MHKKYIVISCYFNQFKLFWGKGLVPERLLNLKLLNTNNLV